MKKCTLVAAMLVVIMLVLTLLPTAALANPPLDVTAWADPSVMKDGEQITINIDISNNIGVEISLTAYEVDGELLQMAETLADGASTTIAYPYIADFGGNQGKSIDVTIYYDDNIGAQHAFADPVDIALAPPDTTTGFSAKADKTEVNSGDMVTFTVKSENKGDTDYNNFTVFASGKEIDTFHLSPGESKTTTHKKSFSSDTDVTFTYQFEYDNFGIIETVEGSDSISITIKEPTPSATDAPTPTPIPTQEAQVATPTQVAQDDPTPSVEAIAVAADDAVPPNKGEGLGTLAIVLISVGAVLLAAVAALTVLMLRRKNAQEKIIKRDDSVL